MEDSPNIVKTLTLFTFYLLFITLTTFPITKSAVSTQHQKHAETHLVKEGKTLFNIAQQYNNDVSQLKQWNNILNSEIEPGQELINRVQSDTTRAGYIEHRVKPKETLFSIAQQYGVDVSDIKFWNKLQSNQINVGQILLIKESAITSGETNITSKSRTPPTQPEQSDEAEQSTDSYYIVKSGDTLYEIANRHDMSVEKLKAINNLTSNNIRIGQRLLVRQPTPVPSVAETSSGSAPQGEFISYKVESRENWSEILQKFDLDSVELAALNPELDYGEIQKGMELTILVPPTSNYENPYRVDAQMRAVGQIPVIPYADTARGSTTTSGQLYNPEALTAAHPSIALGSIIFIQNPRNKRGVYVRINDRISGKTMKLSQKAYNVLHFSSTTPSVKLFQQR